VSDPEVVNLRLPAGKLPEKTYRWSAAARQEALDYHCQVNRLPPAKLEQASGIPDPVRISPKEAIERGWPYVITIDRSEELERVWQRRQREIQAWGGQDWSER
jgi:hypothetical protein